MQLTFAQEEQARALGLTAEEGEAAVGLGVDFAAYAARRPAQEDPVDTALARAASYEEFARLNFAIRPRMLELAAQAYAEAAALRKARQTA
jgi:hypothetical protein